jgi:hypothetical protein
MPLAGHAVGERTRFAAILPAGLASFFCEASVLG